MILSSSCTTDGHDDAEGDSHGHDMSYHFDGHAMLSGIVPVMMMMVVMMMVMVTMMTRAAPVTTMGYTCYTGSDGCCLAMLNHTSMLQARPQAPREGRPKLFVPPSCPHTTPVCKSRL